VTRQPAREVTVRSCGAAADIAALAWRGRVPARSALNRRDLDPGVSLPLSVRAGESG
jgi:hypothetical protein